MNNHTPSLADLEARLAKLERQNRRWQHLGLFFLLIAGSSFLLAQAPRKSPGAAPAPAARPASFDTLVVHRLELRDKAGKLRGLWSVEADKASLDLYDAAGKSRVGLEVMANSSGLNLSNTAGNVGASLAVLADSPVFGLFDAARQARVWLSVLADSPGLDLYDAAGKLRAGFDVTADGPRLVLADAAGKPRVGLGVMAEGPNVALFDAAGETRAALQVRADDGPSLRLQDAQQFQAVVGVTALETIRTGESHKTSAAAVTLFGKDGKIIWRAP
jgi:hypothetical protein